MADIEPNAIVLGTARSTRRDRRAVAVVITISAVLAFGVILRMFTADSDSSATVRPVGAPGFASLPQSANDRVETERVELDPMEIKVNAGDASGQLIRETLKEAERLIRAKQFDQALLSLDSHRPLLISRAEPYLLIGKALEGKRDFLTARDFYLAAIDRDPTLSDAYFGYATASEGLGDLESAIGGMRSYLHTESNPDPSRLKVAQARSAIWEWEADLGRGPWGPTKGVPPGFTKDELRRDGRGVGIKMPILGTEDEAGRRQYEIKAQDKFKMFNP